MLSKVKGFVLSEPSGRPTAAVMFSGALIFLGLHIYFGIVGDTSSFYELIISGAFVLSGTAEFLPNERRQTAGVLRMAAILVLLIVITILIIAPEIINPR